MPRGAKYIASIDPILAIDVRSAAMRATGDLPALSRVLLTSFRPSLRNQAPQNPAIRKQ